MIDPMDTLHAFQDAYSQGLIKLHHGEINPDIMVHMDEPAPNVRRLTYVIIEEGVVIALACLAPTDPLDGKMAFQIAYAVLPQHRRKGLGRKVSEAAIAEIDYGFRRNNIPAFYIEASVDDENEASHRLAKSLFGESAQSGTDKPSGRPLKLYRKLVGKRAFEV